MGARPLFYYTPTKNNMSQGTQDTTKDYHEFIWFVVAGIIGTTLFFVLNESILYAVYLPWQPITMAYFISYGISIFIQYFINASLVFGYSKSTWEGIAQTYAGYTIGLLLSVPINMSLVQYAGASARIAFLLTSILAGIVNYFFLKAFLHDSKKKKT